MRISELTKHKQADAKEKRKRFLDRRRPDIVAYVLLGALIVLFAVATWMG